MTDTKHILNELNKVNSLYDALIIEGQVFINDESIDIDNSLFAVELISSNDESQVVDLLAIFA